MDSDAKKLREEAESALAARRRLDVDPQRVIAALDAALDDVRQALCAHFFCPRRSSISADVLAERQRVEDALNGPHDRSLTK